MTETASIELHVNNLEVTQAIATQLAQLVHAGTIVLLEGNLGSGKTTFMQSFGRALGISSTIASPTFTLIDEYTEGRLPLYHIDLYRLEPSQIPSLHLEEYWRGSDFPLGVVAIEWASKLINIPSDYLQIDLSSPNFSMSEQSQSCGKLQEVQNLAPETGAEYIEDLPQERTIRLTAKGAACVKILKQFRLAE